MLDQCQSSRRLRPIRGEERTIPVMEFPARNVGHATQQVTKMQRRKAYLISKIYMQETMQGERFERAELLSRFSQTLQNFARFVKGKKKGRPPTAFPFKCVD